MESSNSGSFQSSSSADNEEYDSHGDSIASFLNLPLPPSTTSLSSSSSIFYPASPCLIASFPFPSPPQPPLEPNSVNPASSWPRLIQQPSSLPTYSTCTTPAAVAVARSSAASTSNTRPTLVHPTVQAGHSTAAAVPKSSKKRPRASRRAPTTVLATDTSNFRAMVQQFTGFPVPPFASSTSAPFCRPRLDLFNAGSGGAASLSSYLLRSFPPKILAASFPPMTSSSSASSSSLEAIASFARSTLPNMNLPAANTTSNSSCQNLKQFDMQNTSLISQNLLQPHSAPKYTSLRAFGARPHQSSNSAMCDMESFIAAEAMKSTNWVNESGVHDENEEQGRQKD
ncbi:hypothetical protein Cni_G06340 [Canna indica]|uniref:VQ domain-containing protein n=1 Tax=Canna indica TaxID=4628 RepID=A0AAQ3JWU4_9LILI|nr:hypothetical protein Cni_G06340 [Canna indica]